jgi:hypothetical protein
VVARFRGVRLVATRAGGRSYWVRGALGETCARVGNGGHGRKNEREASRGYRGVRRRRVCWADPTASAGAGGHAERVRRSRAGWVGTHGGFLHGNLLHERIDHALGVRLVLCREQKARGAHVPPSEPVRAKIRRGWVRWVGTLGLHADGHWVLPWTK